ncbi:unnamed protein product [Mytilus edulis]|uniref:AIG1-type G domain-containing protein n=1 Tax=Mytilus edulis TaxID=6550 RepID=A0A8S3TZ46_MYTED|nr:unnamed protein product [Mytilus edulis]
MFPNRYGNKKYNTTDISIIDTPAIALNESIFDLRNEFSEQQQHTVVYTVVIAIGRFTAEEKQIIESFISNNNVAHRTLLMFTRKNELDVFDCAEENKLNAWLETTPNIQTWIDKYKLRYFAIDNSSKVNDSFIDDTIKYAVSISQLMAGKPFISITDMDFYKSCLKTLQMFLDTLDMLLYMAYVVLDTFYMLLGSFYM